MYSKEIENLIKALSGFPGVGPKTAARFVFYLSELDEKQREELVQSIDQIGNLSRCRFCFKLFTPQKRDSVLCEICSDRSRQKQKLCVVAKETDLESIEKSNLYKGLYFILGGTVSSLRREDVEKLRVEELVERIKKPLQFGVKSKFKEVILALNPTLEGDSTIIYLKRKLKDIEPEISTLGRGLPTGGELEYADDKTLSSAFRARHKL